MVLSIKLSVEDFCVAFIQIDKCCFGITFNHLTEENFLGIADIMLKELKESLASRGLALSWDDSLRQYLVKKAYSLVYGARNLRRTIQRDLEDPISEKIIDSFENPITSIRICVADDRISLETA